jgi:hypothetical protein
MKYQGHVKVKSEQDVQDIQDVLKADLGCCRGNVGFVSF